MAPFKLRLAKLTKSRSKESSSGNSTEIDDTILQTQGNKTSGHSMTHENTEIEVANADIRSDFPNSPPPSYKHVLDEKRLRPSKNNVKSDEQDNCDRNEVEDNTMVNRRISNEARDNETCLVLRGGKLTLHGPDIIHKSSKELYRAVAKQCGITCKMSDHCRCFDCQSHYFDCDYAKNEQDGGLGAGTPMFIAEVMHGTACILL